MLSTKIQPNLLEHQIIPIPTPPLIHDNTFLAALTGYIILNAHYPEETISKINQVFYGNVLTKTKLNDIIQSIKNNLKKEKKAMASLLMNMVSDKLNEALANYMMDHYEEFMLAYDSNKQFREDMSLLRKGEGQHKKAYIKAFASLLGIPIVVYESLQNAQCNEIDHHYVPAKTDHELEQPIMLVSVDSSNTLACLINSSFLDRKTWGYALTQNILKIPESPRILFPPSKKRMRTKEEKTADEIIEVFTERKASNLLGVKEEEIQSIQTALIDLPSGFIDKFDAWYKLEKIRQDYKNFLTSNFYFLPMEDFDSEAHVLQSYCIGVRIRRDTLIFALYDGDESRKVKKYNIEIESMINLAVQNGKHRYLVTGQTNSWRANMRVNIEQLSAYREEILELINPDMKAKIYQPCPPNFLRRLNQYETKYKVLSMSGISVAAASGFFMAGPAGAAILGMVAGMAFIRKHITNKKQAEFFEGLLEQCNMLIMQHKFYVAYNLLEEKEKTITFGNF